MPPKSQVFRRIERRILGPTMSGLGFDRPRDVGVGTWVRQHQDAWLVVWTQLSKWNYGDDPEGYRFTMEFQLGSQPSGGWDGRRTRYYRLLDPAQKQDHLAIYNRVIAKASPNPAFLSGMARMSGLVTWRTFGHVATFLIGGMTRGSRISTSPTSKHGWPSSRMHCRRSLTDS